MTDEAKAVQAFAERVIAELEKTKKDLQDTAAAATEPHISYYWRVQIAGALLAELRIRKLIRRLASEPPPSQP